MSRKKKTSKDNEKPLEGEALTAEEVSKKYTVAELKSILKENGLSVSGKKKDLVERALPILNDASEGASDESESNEALNSTLSIFGINYDDLAIDDKTIVGDTTNLNIKGFTENGLSMPDFTMSIVAASDSSNVDLKMNIPEVSYTDFENTIFTFNDLDLSILPSSNPQSLEFSAVMDSLEIVTETNYVNLKGLNLFFKSLPEEGGVHLNIDIKSFIYPDFNGTSINFEDLNLDISLGLDGQLLDISANLPKLVLMNKEYRVNLSDLDLNVALADLKLSSLELGAIIPNFHYTNFDDVRVDMENVDVSLEPITNSSVANIIIRMDGLNAAGINSLDELFPMLSINEADIKTISTSSQSTITLNASMPLLDASKMGLTGLTSLLTAGLDLETYLSNMPGQYGESQDADAIDVSGGEVSDSVSPSFDLGMLLENIDYSGLDAIRLNLTGLLDSANIDLSEFGIDMTGYELSDISVSELIDALSNSEFVMTAFAAVTKLLSIDFDKIDFSGLITGFDAENFDISGLLKSLNLSDVDISAIAGLIDMLTNSDIDLASIFENIDLSCLGAIRLNLTGLIDSLGIDLADLGIDLSGYDLSDISLAELMGILSNLEIDMSTISTLLKLVGLELDDLDLEGLISSFDAENFDMSSLLESLNLSESDISGMIDMFTTSDIDFEKIFENCDFTSLDGMVLDLTGVIDSTGIDISDLGVDVSDYDLSAISLPELVGILSDPDLDMDAITSKLGESDSKLDLGGVISSFDAENFDISGILESLNLSDLDITAIAEMFTNSDVDFGKILEGCDLSCLGAIRLNLTGVIDSLGIDLSSLGIDMPDCDLSDISLAELMGIFNNLKIDMSTIAALLKVFGLELDDLDLEGLISSFDAENFDMSSLLESLNLSELDITGLIEIFTNSDVDFASIFEEIDYSCLDAIKLDLTGLLASADIDLAEFGIDMSDYDISDISLADLIDALISSEFVMTAFNAIIKVCTIDYDNLDFSGLVTSFDEENFDMSGILESLKVFGLDISAMMGDFGSFDISEFMNGSIGLFIGKTFPEAVSQ